jgi:predicted nucleotidyltransferase
MLDNMALEAARRYHHEREARAYARRERDRQEWLRRVREAVVRLAPHHPEVRRAYLFGSLTQAGRFRNNSDIDIAVECDTVAAESAFLHALEKVLQRDVDVRPLTGVVKDVATQTGELIYER